MSGIDTVGGLAGYIHNDSVLINCSNIDTVSGKKTVGGVAGMSYPDGIENCYYLDTCISENAGIANEYGKGKTGFEFNSGEVAWLLQDDQEEGSGQVRGQLLTGDDKDKYPFLDGSAGKTVEKLGDVIYTDANGSEKAVYVNPPAETAHIPDGGQIETDDDGALILPEGSTVTKDGETTTVPKGGAKFDPGSGELTPTEKPDNETEEHGKDETYDPVNSSAVTAEDIPENMELKVSEVSENSDIVKILQNDPRWSLAACYDVELFEGETQIYKLDSTIRLRFEIPEKKIADNRKFAVLRLHGSSVELLSDVDTRSDSVTVETDRFSIYAPVYKTAEAPSTDTDDDPKDNNTDNSTGDDTNSGSDNHDTGRPIAGITAIVLAGAVSFTAVTAKKK